MAGQEDSLLGGCEQPTPGVTLTDSLVTMRNLGETPHPESRSTGLLPPSTPHLDLENSCAVGRLQSLQGTHSLYLQQNQTKKIENLGCLPSPRFLSLAGNHIHREENLQPPQHLCALDPSHNRTQTLGTDELPHSLLDLTGNNCAQQQGYREPGGGALPHLLQLDGQTTRGSRGEEEQEAGSSSSEDEDDDESLSEPSSPFTADKDFFVELHQEMAGRSRQRRREALEEHQTRLEELEVLQERQDLLQGRQGPLLPPAPLSPGREGAAAIATPGPRGSRPHRQAKAGTQLPALLCPGRQRACLQPQPKALEEKTRAKGVRNRPFPKTPRASTAPRGGD